MKKFIRNLKVVIYKPILQMTGKIVFKKDNTMETISGDYIGMLDYGIELIDFFFKHGIDLATLQSPYGERSNVVALAFSPREQKWYGWSHRAMYGFKIGDVVKEGDCCASSGWTKEYLKEHPEKDKSLKVGFKATNLKEAKRMAIAFAESVS